MDTHKKELLEHFLSSAIGTLEADKIYDILLATLVELLHPDGLLITLNQRTGYCFDVIRTYGSITCEKNYSYPCLDAIAMLTGSENIVDLTSEASLPFVETLTARKQAWLKEQDISFFYPIRYN